MKFICSMVYYGYDSIDLALLIRSHCWPFSDGVSSGCHQKKSLYGPVLLIRCPACVKSCPPPLPSECIAALNSPQCLAVSQFQCDVFTSRSNETGERGIFRSSLVRPQKTSAQGGRTQTFRQRTETSILCYSDASVAFYPCFVSSTRKRYFVAVRVEVIYRVMVKEEKFCGIRAFYLCLHPKLHFGKGTVTPIAFAALR